jgi:hypothetical protein
MVDANCALSRYLNRNPHLALRMTGKRGPCCGQKTKRNQAGQR